MLAACLVMAGTGRAAEPVAALPSSATTGVAALPASAATPVVADALDTPTSDAAERPSSIVRAAPPRSATPALDVGPAVIRAAIADMDRDAPVPHTARANFGASATAQRARIDRRFDEATIESCGGTGAFKFDPPVIGPLVFGGFFSLPFLVHAMATGRCRFVR